MPKQNGNVQKHGGLAREADCAVLKALSVVYDEVTPEELQAFIGMKQPERVARLREAILGKKVDDTVEVQAPKGTVAYTITEVRY